MAAVYDREVVVYVWRYKPVMGFIPSSHFGHAAVKLRGVLGAPDDKTYISWWPGEGAGIEDAFRRQPGIQSNSLSEDKYDEMNRQTRANLQAGAYQPRPGQQFKNGEWEQKPDFKIHLPAQGARGAPVGLNIVRMYKWWHAFRLAPERQYKLASKRVSCAGVAALALLAGGASLYATPPSALLFLDPNQIQAWASQVGQALTQINQAASTLGQAIGRYNQDTSTKLMSYAAWKALSDQNFSGPFRSKWVKAIDEAVKQFHLPGRSREQKFDSVRHIMMAARDFLVHKPASQRGDAVVRLSLQAMAVFDHLRDQQQKEWAHLRNLIIA
jgi:hypothetical protein